MGKIPAICRSLRFLKSRLCIPKSTLPVFNVDTTSELAFGPENHGLPRRPSGQVRQVAEQLRLESLLDRSIFSLSGGEKQKIACGSAAAIEPDIYVWMSRPPIWTLTRLRISENCSCS